jgi:transporter family-2 protein
VTQVFFYGLALLAGISNPLQSAANAALNKGIGQPLAATLVVYAVALCGLLICTGIGAVAGISLGGLSKVGGLPWWAFVGGLCQLTFTVAAAVSTQKIGSAGFTVTVLVVAVVLSIALDKYGLMGLEVRDATWPRLLGAALAIVGVTLVSIF